MKGNLFKTTKNQSFGYEPKENARYNRNRGSYIDKIENQKNLFSFIFKNDDFKKLKQYRTVLINYFLEDMYIKTHSEMNSEWVIRNIEENNACMCFYFLNKELESKGFKLPIPTKFEDFYIKMERTKKIERLKNNIKKD